MNEHANAGGEPRQIFRANELTAEAAPESKPDRRHRGELQNFKNIVLWPQTCSNEVDDQARTG